MMLKKSLYILLLLLAIFMIGFACQSGAQLLHLPLDLTANKGAGQVLLYLIVLGSIVWFTRRVWKQDPKAAAGLYGQNWGRVTRGFWTCAAISLVLQAPIYVYLIHSGILSVSDYAKHKPLPALIFNILISQLVMVVLATSEESIFRGFLFNYLRDNGRKDAVVGAVILSSVIFALSHEFHTLNHWLQPAYYGKLIGLVLLGVLLSVTYYSTRSIACSIGVHASLLWLDEIRRQTMDLHQTSWWTGTNSDLRTAPFVWLIFGGLTLLFAFFGKTLRPTIGIEPEPRMVDESPVTAIEPPSPVPAPQPQTATPPPAPAYRTAPSAD